MKIAVTGTRGFPGVQGGVESHCEKLYELLAKRGCDIVVYAREPYCGTQIRTFNGIKIIPLSCPKNKFLEAIFHTLKSVIRASKLRPDVLHIHSIGPSLFVPLARILGMKVVVTNHGPDYMRKKWSLPAKIFLKFCERVGMTYADRVIAISKNISDDINKKYDRESAVIPNGVIVLQPSESFECLKKYNLQNKRYLLSVGRFVPEKGFDDLIDAFNQSKIGQWKLVIVGDADHENSYSAMLKSKVKSNSDIVLTGLLKGQPLHELYSHAGLFVIPSYYEGLPIVLLEAMSYGLSCIASDIPANSSVELGTERFFRAGDIGALSRKIKEFIDKPLDEKQRARQLSLINSRYNWEVIAEETLRVYISALSEG